MTTDLSTDALQFVADRHLAMLSTVARDGTIHQVAVGFTVHDGKDGVPTYDATLRVRAEHETVIAEVTALLSLYDSINLGQVAVEPA